MKNTESKVINKFDRGEIIRNVKEASLTSYGVSGVFSSNKKGKEEDGIYVHFDKENNFSLDIHIYVMEGVKVTETIRSLRKTIKFYMEHLYPKACTKINIYAEGISSTK